MSGRADPPGPAAPGNGAGTGSLSGLQVIVGLFAGIAALIYLTGGAALGLRLLWAELPAVPVGQMPRDFLFSLGAAQIVLPALALGLVAGLIELGQDQRGLRDGHRSWSYAKRIPALRRTYIAFYGAITFVLISPGIAIAVSFDDDIDDKAHVLALVAIVAVGCLLVWVGLAWTSRLDTRVAPQVEHPMHDLRWLAWCAVLSGLFFTVGLALWMWLGPPGDANYFGFVGAWVVALLFALLVVWLRGTVGHHVRSDPRAEGVAPQLVVVSWSATALLAVPLLICVTATSPLTEAVVCGDQADKPAPYTAAGLFVGETKDRVYIGDTGARRIVSVPASKVSHLVVGRDAADPGACTDTGR